MLLLKNLVFTVLVPGTVAGLVPYRIVSRGGSHPPLDATRLDFAAPLAVLGLGAYFWCVWDFAVIGRATPAPIDPPKHLVARGLYRWVRNPMYVGVWLVRAAWAVTFRSGAVVEYGIVVALFFHLFVVTVEEPLCGGGLARRTRPTIARCRGGCRAGRTRWTVRIKGIEGFRGAGHLKPVRPAPRSPSAMTLPSLLAPLPRGAPRRPA